MWLLSRKNLGHLAAFNSLVARTKNETATPNTRRCKAQRLDIFPGQRHGVHYVEGANIAREATHSKDKRGAPGATGSILARASRTRRKRRLLVIFNKSIG